MSPLLATIQAGKRSTSNCSRQHMQKEDIERLFPASAIIGLTQQFAENIVPTYINRTWMLLQSACYTSYVPKRRASLRLVWTWSRKKWLVVAK
jgi:hypothetical protein